MEGVGNLIWVVTELSRRHGNHKPQRFDFLIECKLNYESLEGPLLKKENIFYLVITRKLTRNNEITNWRYNEKVKS